jgi:hypothetical protein
MTTLNPTTILVRDRQRRQVSDLDANFVASVNKRLIHPIVVRRSFEYSCETHGCSKAGTDFCLAGEFCKEVKTEKAVLVAGGQRLAALIQGGTTALVEGTHFRFMDDLSPVEAKQIELEENIKRQDLEWRDYVSAVAELNTLYKEQNPSWTVKRLASELNVHPTWLTDILTIYKNLDSTSLREASGIDHALRILQTLADRRAASIVSQIAQTGKQIFQQPLVENSDVPTIVCDDNNNNNVIVYNNKESDKHSGNVGEDRKTEPERQSPPILNLDFLSWAAQYSGPKFNLIHCDFPFGIGVFDGTGMKPNQLGAEAEYDDESDSDIFFKLLNGLVGNLDRLASYQSHLMIWFSMNHYEPLKETLKSAGLFVLNHPLIWHKTDDRGIVPGRGNHPRRVYETAMLASRGQRPLSKKFSNCYGAPTAEKPIHPSQKPEPVLRYFFAGLVDETTDVLDPTAGSGTALRAAEDCGARSVLGLELSPSFAEAANLLTLSARKLREATRL